ncbi:threonine/serine dehydratase [Streptomyces sp. NPDC092296]|uniref:threonine ammonia-lyase n=1 Tax=Streptomyces sp. NPDC092296 TaxID=3366012 RepID=UPI00381CB0BC
MALVTRQELAAARERIAGVAVRTPLMPCPWADDEGRSLLLKPENLQPTGAFKLRGAYNRLAALTPAEAACGVVAQSSGNHAQAVAYAARLLGIKAVIVMPDVSPAVKVEATRSYGADVRLVPAEERDIVPRQLAAEYGYIHVPPYDDPDIIAGQGTIGLEIADDAAALGLAVDTVLVPVSGGGLISGVAAAVKLTMPGVRVIGVEPELAADAQQSLRTGELVRWSVERTYRTLADGLRTVSVGELPFEHLTAYVDDIVTVSEDDIRAAVAVLARRGRIVAEPSGAVAPAAYLFHRDELPPGRTHVAVVSGGNIDPRLLAELLAA